MHRSGGVFSLLPLGPLVRSVFCPHLQRRGVRLFLVHDIFEEQNAIKYAGSNGACGQLYTIGCKGRKSHGYLASVTKTARVDAGRKDEGVRAAAADGRHLVRPCRRALRRGIFGHPRAAGRVEMAERASAGRARSTSSTSAAATGRLLNALSGRIKTGIGVDESAGDDRTCEDEERR